MANYELEPVAAESVDPVVQEAINDEIPDQVYEISAQIGRIMLNLEESGVKPREYPFPYGPSLVAEDGSQSLTLRADSYPGRGVIMDVAMELLHD